MRYPKYKYFYAITDLVIVLFSFALAEYVTDLYYDNNYKLVVDTIPPSQIYSLPTAIFFVFIFQYNLLYKSHVFLTKVEHLINIIKSIIQGSFAFIIFTFFANLEFTKNPRLFVGLFSLFIFLAMIFFRVFLLSYLYRKLSKGGLVRRNILIAGAGKNGKLLTTRLLMNNDLGFKILGFLDDNVSVGKEIAFGLNVIGKIDEIKKIEKEKRLDEIIIAIDNIEYERLIEIVDICKRAKISVKINSELLNVIPRKVQTEMYAGIPVIDTVPPLANTINWTLKRIVDILGAFLGLIILSPFLIFIAVAIKLTSKGPVFFKQERVGKDGKRFKFLKFRSMTVEQEGEEERQKQMIEFIKKGKGDEGAAKIINEKRVTKIGKILRKYSLDELPQLINVLKGEMSLVGPRPALPYEYENYEPWQKKRVSVLPGCTGVWQVSGRSSVNFTDSVLLDLYYIYNASPWLDMKIILKTIPVILFAKGGK